MPTNKLWAPVDVTVILEEPKLPVEVEASVVINNTSISVPGISYIEG